MKQIFIILWTVGVSLALPVYALAGQAASERGGGYRWALLLLVLMIIFLFVMRRWQRRSKLARLNQTLTKDGQIHNREMEFFLLMSQLAGKPPAYEKLKKMAEQWEQFHLADPGNKYGIYANSLLSAVLASAGEDVEKQRLLQQSGKQAQLVAGKMKIEHHSLLYMALAQGYMGLVRADNEENEKHFTWAAGYMRQSLNGELKVYQMVNILLSLGQAYQQMAAFREDKTLYLQQAFDYLSMAIALSPQNRASMPAMNHLCAGWAAISDKPEEKEKLLSISGQCRFGRYQQISFDRDLWLARLAALMGNEKNCRDKLREMLEVQEELLYKAMRADSYLRVYQDKPWYARTMDQARQFSV